MLKKLTALLLCLMMIFGAAIAESADQEPSADAEEGQLV